MTPRCWMHPLTSLGRWTSGPRLCDVWRCPKCGRKRNLYPRPWRWLWASASRDDIDDGVFSPVPWLGEVPGVGWRRHERLLAIIPLNVILGVAVRLYWRLRCPDESRVTSALGSAYRGGIRDGLRQAKGLPPDWEP